MAELGALPPGWDTKFDPRTGRYYFINHYTKATTWEDPRVRYQQIGKPVSSAASTSSKENTRHGGTTSHDLLTSGSDGAPMQDISNRRAGASQSGRRESHNVLENISEVDSQTGSNISGGGMSKKDDGEFHKYEVNSAVAAISSMFPTVDESHIRDLLKKYHNSQAVVISALQVAKHPFITPGPSSVFTPPPTRHSTLPGVAQGVLAGITMTGSLPYYYGAGGGSGVTPVMGLKHSAVYGGGENGAGSISSSGYPTPRPGSAASGFDMASFYMGSPQIGGSHASNLFRSFPRPHSSPKMKLRYLKSVFPTVEEYLLLDILSNSDNNVQKAADRLVKMGYVKRDTPSAPRLHARKKEEERLAEKRTPLPKPPQLKSDKEKQELRRKMCNKYEKKYDIPERILFMALESVLYDEEQANHLIMSMIEDDLKRQKSKEAEKLKEKEKRKSPKPNRRALAESERTSRHSSPKHEPKGPEGHGKKGWSKDSADGIPKTSRGTSTQQERPYKSEVSGKAKGPNPSLRKGPNDDLLLTDYVCWNGPDHENRKGPNKTIAKGPNMSLRAGPGGIANGPNPTLRKGPSGRSNGPITNHSNLGMNHSSSVPRPQGLPALVTVM